GCDASVVIPVQDFLRPDRRSNTIRWHAVVNTSAPAAGAQQLPDVKFAQDNPAHVADVPATELPAIVHVSQAALRAGFQYWRDYYQDDAAGVQDHRAAANPV